MCRVGCGCRCPCVARLMVQHHVTPRGGRDNAFTLYVMRRVVLLLLCLSLSSCAKSASRSQVEAARMQNDPAALKLEPAYNDYARRTILPDGDRDRDC